jgi:hypothetical protein
MKNTLILIVILMASPAFAGWSWTDNGDGTQELAETQTERKWIYRCAHLVFPGEQQVCTSAGITEGTCPAEALDARFPVVRALTCHDSDVPARCTQPQADSGDTWTPEVIQCGDGTYPGDGKPYDVDCIGAGDPHGCCTEAGAGTCNGVDAYDKFPGNRVQNQPEYGTICKNKWKNNGWWVPELGNCKVMVKDQAKRQHNNQMIGRRRGGEQLIQRASEAIPTETADQ